MIARVAGLRLALAAQGALIGAAVMRHVQLRREAVGGAWLQRELTSSLPARERELVAHIMGGCTTKEAARRMGIALTTALTYRYRAFQHLGIRTQRELIGLFSPAVPVCSVAPETPGHLRSISSRAKQRLPERGSLS